MIPITIKITHKFWNNSTALSKFLDKGLFFKCLVSIFPDINKTVPELIRNFTN